MPALTHLELAVKEGKIEVAVVDASFVEVPRQRSRKEDESHIKTNAVSKIVAKYFVTDTYVHDWHDIVNPQTDAG